MQQQQPQPQQRPPPPQKLVIGSLHYTSEQQPNGACRIDAVQDMLNDKIKTFFVKSKLRMSVEQGGENVITFATDGGGFEVRALVLMSDGKILLLSHADTAQHAVDAVATQDKPSVKALFEDAAKERKHEDSADLGKSTAANQLARSYPKVSELFGLASGFRAHGTGLKNGTPGAIAAQARSASAASYIFQHDTERVVAAGKMSASAAQFVKVIGSSSGGESMKKSGGSHPSGANCGSVTYFSDVPAWVDSNGKCDIFDGYALAMYLSTM